MAGQAELSEGNLVAERRVGALDRRHVMQLES